ncbi:MAG: HlyD family efflux transporter periplasmic adaptor subunit [Bryobacterales bacterium]|nr:HlyD family efflux transporter periplasmic adaptor subunit [Bryobacterales bacterium]
MKKLPIAVLAAVIAAAIVWGIRSRNAPLDTRIRFSGNLEMTQVNIAFKVPGKLIERNFNEGDPVKKGAVVARLDPERVTRERGSAQQGVTVAESQLVLLRTAIEQQRESLAAETQLRQAEIAEAQAHLDQLLAGSRKQEIQLARAAVEEIKTEHERAAKDWQRAQALFLNEDISTQQRDQFKGRFDGTQAALDQARQRLALAEEGPRKEDVAAARAQVARAQAALRLTESARIELRRKEQETATRRAEIERARAQVSVLDSQVSDNAALSPLDGVVLSKAAEAGEVLAAGANVLTIADVEHPWLRGYIAEQDLGRVKVGAKVRVSTDSFSGKVYEGRLTFIASDAEFTPKQIQTAAERVKLVYRVKVEIPNPARELKLNMPADAEIVIEP